MQVGFCHLKVLNLLANAFRPTLDLLFLLQTNQFFNMHLVVKCFKQKIVNLYIEHIPGGALFVVLWKTKWLLLLGGW
jgi:hypothetical protein